MKKIALFSLALTAILASATALLAQSGNPICHVTGNGSANLIYIAAQALDAHYAHGDYTPQHIAGVWTCDASLQ